MKTLVRDTLWAVVMGFLVPILVMGLFASGRAETMPEVTTETAGSSQGKLYIPMLLRGKDGVTELREMDEYLLSVVLAEMPASFEEEALKAQAVAARTYTRKAWVTGGKHGDGSVCTLPGCCQGYLSVEEYKKQGGREEDVEKVRIAVEATRGMVLTYEGELIEATYFSCSGGYTEDALAVWGTDFPYLQAIRSPGEEAAACYWNEVSFLPEQLREKLGIEGNTDVRSWFGEVTYTDGGGVATMEIGGKTYTGTQLRSILGLHSTAFSVEASGERITFLTRGYGHRVGMSQYGADAMAAAGSTYREILSHYYQGAEVSSLNEPGWIGYP